MLELLGIYSVQDAITWAIIGFCLGIVVVLPLWLIIAAIIISILDLNPRCPECDRKIVQDNLGLSPKFTCLCGVRGTVSINWIWANRLEDWISPNEQKEKNNT